MHGARIRPDEAAMTACPSCGKPQDPLRAGQVAILEGQFFYFCDRECKAAFMRDASSRSDALTAEPPLVSATIAAAAAAAHVASPASPPAPPSGPAVDPRPSSPRDAADDPPPSSPRDDADEPPPSSPAAATGAPPAVSATPAPPTARSSLDAQPDSAPVPPPSSPVRSRRGDGDAREQPRERFPSSGQRSARRAALEAPVPTVAERESASPMTVAPATLRSSSTPDGGPASDPSTGDVRAGAAAAPVAPTARRERFLDVVTYAGITCGVLAWAVALLGASGVALKVPLAAIAQVVMLLRAFAAEGDPARPRGLVAYAPPACALGAAVWARAAGDPHAAAIASLAGLSAAAALVVSLLADREAAVHGAWRERIASALAADARVVRGDDTVIVPAEQVRAGEQVVVEAGDVIGVDALVSAGEALVTPWLDAPVEMSKREGDAIVAGAKIVSGRLRLMTTWSALERAWIRLALSPLQRVDVAAPLARLGRALIERGAPLAALLVGAAVFTSNGSAIETVAAAAAAAIAFGAWGVAAVVAFHHARAQCEALAHGIVFKDAAAFHDAGAIDVAVLCSRGTVLMGEPEIVALEPLAQLDANRVLSLAAGAETASTHPLASAILRAARNRGARIESVRNASVHAGLGVTALSSAGERLVVGSRGLLLQERVSVALADSRVSELEAQGRSVLLVALGGKLVGLLALQDGLRAGARAAVQRLHDARIEPVLLSGEARETCATIGGALDIDHIRPEVLPADRGGVVRALREGGHAVAVLGHPESDDAALGAADISVAMCAAGATPGEWGVALASDDVRDAALALGLARTARDRSTIALAIGLVPGAAAALAIAFGVAPLALAPVAQLAGSLAAAVHARR